MMMMMMIMIIIIIIIIIISGLPCKVGAVLSEIQKSP